jgi:tripartite-type tricarboxylate transporter receptor subunit TctC
MMFVDLLPSLQLIAEGKVRPLAISSVTRASSLPDVPPLAEAGVPGFDAPSWLVAKGPGF